MLLLDWLLKNRSKRRKVPLKPPKLSDTDSDKEDKNHSIEDKKQFEEDKKKSEEDKKQLEGKKQLKQLKSQQKRRSKCNIVLEIVVIFIGSILMFFGFIEGPIQPVSFKLPAPPKFEGVLAANTKLQEATNIFQGRVFGPESIAIKDGVLYTGIDDGRLIAINGTEVNTIASFHASNDKSLPCGIPAVEHLCGRPLGLRFDKSRSSLYIIEAYSGLYKINLTSGTAQHLSKYNDQYIGEHMQFVNDLDVTSEGVVYFSDSSSQWSRRDNAYLGIEGSATGRIFKYDPSTDRTEVVLDDLTFPNGVQLSPNEDFLLFCETTYARINLLFLKGTMKGQVVSFVENLPGLPDNIRASSNGGYWVGFGVVRKQPFSLFDFFSNKPWVRSYISKIIPPDVVSRYMPKYGLIVELDQLGNIKQSWHDPSGEVVPGCSEVLDTGDALYLGSYNNPFIAKVILKK